VHIRQGTQTVLDKTLSLVIFTHAAELWCQFHHATQVLQLFKNWLLICIKVFLYWPNLYHFTTQHFRWCCFLSTESKWSIYSPCRYRNSERFSRKWW
jgi:hypothetical protein